MVKRFTKCCLIAALACTLSTSAMAMGLVTGVLSMQFGQENLGDPDKDVDRDETSHLTTHWLGSIGLEAIGQQMSAQVKLKLKSGRTHRYDEPQFEAEEMQVNYQATDGLKIGIGHFDIEDSHGFVDGAAAPTAPFVPGKYGNPYTWAKAYGASILFQVSDSLRFNLGLFSSDPFRQGYLGDHGYCGGPAGSTECSNVIHDKYDPSQPGAGGSGMVLTVSGAVGSFEYRAAYMTGTAKDDTSSDVEAINSSAMTISGKYTMIGAFDVAFDYMSMNKGWQNKDSAKLATTMALSLGVPAGPGKFLAAYAVENINFDVNWSGIEEDNLPVSDVVFTNLAYEIPMEPISSITLLYTSRTETWTSEFEDKLHGEKDPYTESFIGVSFKKVY